jgi:hypothetical protein
VEELFRQEMGDAWFSFKACRTEANWQTNSDKN